MRISISTVFVPQIIVMFSVATIVMVLFIDDHVPPRVLDEYIDKQTKCPGDTTPDQCTFILFFQNDS